MAGRARWLAILAIRFGCSVPEVRAMTQREANAMTELLDERDRARQEQAMVDEARANLAARRRRR